MKKAPMRPPRWRAAAFRKKCERSGVSAEALSVALGDHGYCFGSSAVRKWQRGGSSGPKHPIVAVLVLRLVGALSGQG